MADDKAIQSVDDKAIQLIALFDKTFHDDHNFRNIYQEVADVMFPRESEITTERAKGEILGRDIVDVTGLMASIDATAGLSINIFPPGDKFYNVLMEDAELNEIDAVKRKLGEITEISHAKRIGSNFMLQANETLRSWITFGTGCMFSEWKADVGLNYKDYDVGMYTFLENDSGLVDTMMIEFKFTAKQAFQKWGDDAGETVLEKMKDDKTQTEDFKFVWITRPRDLAKQKKGGVNKEKSFETIYISRTDNVIVEEGGYDEFPFQVPRWSKSSREKWGRGVGTWAIGIVNALQVKHRDLDECGNLHNNPPKEVLESFEGEVRVSPGDLNFVTEMGSIKAIQQQALGNWDVTLRSTEIDQRIVRKMFFNDAFNQLEDLKGDRRNELEIRSRLAEGLRKLVSPVGRLQTEWLTGLVTRDIGLLERNGVFGDMPPEMAGKSFKIEYVGRLALELQAAQSIGWLRWVEEGAVIEASIPGTLDNVDVDEGYRRRGMTLGVSVDDMASKEEVDQKRQARLDAQQAQREMEMATLAAQNYSGGTKAPEQGSASEKLMEQIG
jgi:hypothetical protein